MSTRATSTRVVLLKRHTTLFTNQHATRKNTRENVPPTWRHLLNLLFAFQSRTVVFL